MLFISYYTPNYKEEANRLIKSLDKFGLKYIINEIESKGSWQKNTQYKPEFIEKKLRFYNMPVIWVDADAEIVQYPAVFGSLNCDIAYVMFNGELLTGTLYLQPTERVFELLRLWREEVSRNDRFSEQKVLRIILKNFKCNKVELPQTYCQIFDTMADVGEPVIIQYQASRKHGEV